MFNKNSQIFLLGHMRSRSTLLAHILLKNNTIFGLGESNKVYKNRLDVFKMRIKTRLYSKTKIPFKFTFLDQINHNQKTPNLKLLKSSGKLIILVRTPEETFESIRILTKNFYKEWSHQEIETYYLQRLNFLMNLQSNTSKKQIHTINSEALIKNTSDTLSALSTFLRLKQPLSENYDIQAFTGTHGDPSALIQTGKIMPTEKQVYAQTISNECYSLFKEIID